MKTFVVIGGGAAGYFAAINAAEKHPDLKVIILEASAKVLQKVKVSGGGRCNVTNACFDPKELTAFYPRGQKELRGPFHQFMTGDTMQWFEDRDVPLKIEDDNRVFPKSNNSQSIISCFLGQADKFGIELLTNHRVSAIKKQGNVFEIATSQETFMADYVLIATGSTAKMFPIIEKLGHEIMAPVPSLFTFNIKDERLKDLLGISVPFGSVKIVSTKLNAQGPILITHWGLSGPGILKLSAWGALELHQKGYQFEIEVNWLSKNQEDVLELLKKTKTENPKKKIALHSPLETISKRLWERLAISSQILESTTWAELSSLKMQNLAKQLTQSIFKVNGKSTFKEEFVTAGGVDLKEINFKRFESKLHPNLFFAGEVLNIDAVTGGFNFQNAWTGGWIVANALN
ncbi:MAG: NAD(P)/FAD-dependent oxidoreductase [Flavobacteriales bacterium]|jgi:predicted Rossmann fold flavoprotein|nr:NAD(P)/FAD-dependent oxidoreductase [Flavobacteriales bacterium]